MKIKAEEDEEKAQAALRAEDDDAPPSSKEPPSKGGDDDDDDDDEDKGRDIPTKCGYCGVENHKTAKFCMGCGKSMATKKMDDDEDEDEEEKSAAAHPPPPERMEAPRKMSTDASTASILKSSSESPLSIKTAAIDHAWLRATVEGVTGKTDIAEMVGALLAIPAKLDKGKRAQASLGKLKTKRDDAERADLCARLIKTGTVNRSRVFADVVNEKGVRTDVRIRSRYLNMDLGVLRGMVTDLEGDAPKKRRDPFEPSQELARDTAKTGQHGTVEQRIERAKKSPEVLRLYNRPGNTLSLEALAKSHVNNNFDIGARA